MVLSDNIPNYLSLNKKSPDFQSGLFFITMLKSISTPYPCESQTSYSCRLNHLTKTIFF